MTFHPASWRHFWTDMAQGIRDLLIVPAADLTPAPEIAEQSAVEQGAVYAERVANRVSPETIADFDLWEEQVRA